MLARAFLVFWLSLSSVFAAAAAEVNRNPAPPAMAAPDDGGGKWQLSLETAADGIKTIVARLPADAPIPSGFDQVTPYLLIKYHAGRAVAYIVFDTFLGSGKLDAVATFGDESPERQTWRISADGRSAFVPGEALAFVERLKAGPSFTLRVAPRKKPPVTVTFTTTGIQLVMKALISAGVKYGG